MESGRARLRLPCDSPLRCPAGAGWLKFSSRGADPHYSRHVGSDPALLLTVIRGATRPSRSTSAAFGALPDFKPANAIYILASAAPPA